MNLGEVNSARNRLEEPDLFPVNPTEILDRLSILLEEHAPTWYTEKLRHRVLAARRLPTDVLVELYALLEDYSPSWYSDDQHNEALSVLRALGLLETEIDKLT